MADADSLAAEFETHRAHLRGVTYRVLGSVSDADDAVQETWLRLSRTDVSGVLNLRAWLTTVAGRVALNMLQARGSRREEVSDSPAENLAGSPGGGPEDEVLLGDSVGAALQVVLDTLEPREWVAFVLHDLFGVPFDEIAPVVDGSGAAARQLASRARRRLRAASAGPDAGGAGGTAGAGGTVGVAVALAGREERQRSVVAAFFAAAREAQFAALLEILDPDVVMRADAAAARMGAAELVTGSDVVARWMSGRARGAVLATVGDEPGAAWVVGGQVRVAFSFTITADGRIAGIDLIGDGDALAGLAVELA
jgi:RNA polymerase sigma factor (sigma-70 family)